MAYEEHGDGHGYARGNVQNKTAGTYGYARRRGQHRGEQRITEGRATSTTGSWTRRLDADVHGCEVEGVDQVHAGLDYWLLEARTSRRKTPRTTRKAAGAVARRISERLAPVHGGKTEGVERSWRRREGGMG